MDALVIMTPWPAFGDLDADQLAGSMAGHAVMIGMCPGRQDYRGGGVGLFYARRSAITPDGQGAPRS